MHRAPLLSLHHLCQTSGCRLIRLGNIRFDSPSTHRSSVFLSDSPPPPFLPSLSPFFSLLIWGERARVCVLIARVRGVHVFGFEDQVPSIVLAFTIISHLFYLSHAHARALRSAIIHALSSPSQSHTLAGSGCVLVVCLRCQPWTLLTALLTIKNK